MFLLVRRWTHEGRLDRRTVIVGADDRGEALIRSLATQRDSDVRLLGVFDDRGEVRTQADEAVRQKLGTVDDLVAFARKTRIDLVIFALPISAEGRILQMLKKLWVLPVDVRLASPFLAGYLLSLSTFGWPRTRTSCASGRAPTRMWAMCPCSTFTTSPSRTGTS